jgi:hypothetical protein
MALVDRALLRDVMYVCVCDLYYLRLLDRRNAALGQDGDVTVQRRVSSTSFARPEPRSLAFCPTHLPFSFWKTLGASHLTDSDSGHWRLSAPHPMPSSAIRVAARIRVRHGPVTAYVGPSTTLKQVSIRIAPIRSYRRCHNNGSGESPWVQSGLPCAQLRLSAANVVLVWKEIDKAQLSQIKVALCAVHSSRSTAAGHCSQSSGLPIPCSFADVVARHAVR